MQIKRLVVIVLVNLFVSGCATNVIQTFTNTPDYSKLYLRGVFSWWEADEKYKVIQLSNNVFATKIELIADGQPYDFKFADANWSPDLNCGYANVFNDQIVIVNEVVSANCERTDENFKFTPSETGLYEFSIDFSGFGSPKVLIRLVN
jgi:hypothetical protein